MVKPQAVSAARYNAKLLAAASRASDTAATVQPMPMTAKGLLRDARRPDTGPPSAAPADGPRKANPAINGSSPRTCCRFIVDKNTVTTYAMLATVPATTNVVKRALRSSDRLINGKRTRVSTATNAAKSATESKNTPITGADSHPQAGARSKANVNNPIPNTISARPVRSIRRGAVSSEVSGMVL